MRTTKLRAIAVAASSLLALVAVLAPGVVDARKKRSTVTIVVNGGDFSGKVKTKKAACVAEREVIVFQQNGASPNPTTDTEVATDTSDDNGRWNTGNTGANDGRYYAHAPATATCKALTSRTVRVTGRPAEPDV